MTSVAFDHDLVELLRDEPELLAIADAIVTTQSARRLRPAGRRRLALAVAAALAIVVAAPALGLHRTIVSFFDSEPAPERTQIQFAQMGIAAPVGLGPNVIHEETRKVMERELDGKLRPLYVAPTKSGGFCWLWEGRMGSCGRAHPEQRALGVTWLESAKGPTLVSGHVLDPAIEKLELRYEDGREAEIPIVWVSPPIDAGFYVYEVAPETLGEGHRAQFLVALDGDGDEVVRHEFRYQDPRWESGADGLPQIADRTQKRTLFDFRAESGARWTLVTAPAPGDKLCYAYNGGGGCNSPKFPNSRPLSAQGGAVVSVCCTVSAATETVELVYEDGDRTVLRPVDGFLLATIPSAHYALGRRVEAIVEHGRAGEVVARHDVPTRHRGIYPCADEDEIDLGFGTTICP